MSAPLDLVLGLLPKHRKAGPQEWSARCPAHDDKNPSLSIGVGDDGRVLIRCQAGCDTDAVLKAIGLSLADLFPRNGNGDCKSEIVDVYRYTNGDGTPAYDRVRTIPKDFFYRRPNGETGLAGTQRVLYHLPQLIATPKDALVFLVEGERDVHTVEKMVYTATTPGGAKDWKAAFAPYFTGRKVVLLPDNDDPGRGYSNAAAADITKVAASTKVVQLPGLPAGGDITDWVAGQDPQGVREVLLELIDQAPEWKAAAEIVVNPNPLIMAAGTARDLLNIRFPDDPPLIRGFLYRAGLSQITGPGGSGKTKLAFEQAAALASEKLDRWMDLHVVGTCNIGFLGMEGQADRYQPRIQEVVTLYGEDWLSRFHLRAPGFGGRSTWDMAGDPEVRAQIQEFIEHYQLKVLYADPFTHTKTGTLKEESPSDMTVVLEAFAEIRDATGCAIVLLHHPPYGRIAGRGSTVLHNVLDAEISLEGQGAIEEWSRPGGKVKMIWTKPDRDGLTPAPKMLVRRNNGSLALSDESCDTAGVDQDWTRIETILGLHGGMTFPELKKKIADAGFAKSDTTLRRIVETMASNRRIQYFSKQGATGYVQPIGISTSPNLSMDTSPTGEVDITQDNPIC